jgi:SulP family sulfate permease
VTPSPDAAVAGRSRALFPFLQWWPRVNRGTLQADAVAGLIGAIIVLPQAALFGSSWHLVSGPTNVISIFVFSSVSVLAVPGSDDYIRLVLTLTFLAGAMQLAMGLARLGTLVNFISHTVIVGFTAGAACLIVTAQLRDFFGVELPRASLPQVWSHFVLHLDTINPYATTAGLATLATAVLSRKLVPRFPYMITAMLAGTGAAFALRAAFGERAEIATVSAVVAALPPLSLPDLSPDVIQRTLPVAFAVTILALTEAVSIARSIAVKSGQRIDGSQEFIGQGLSNLAASFFSSYASSGSFNRSGLNYEAGARTPLAAVFSALILAVIVLAVAPLLTHLPLAVMAAVLFIVAYGIVDTHYIAAVLRTSRLETAIMLITFLAALFADLEFAIYAGVLMSLLIYLSTTSHPLILDVKPDPAPDSYHFTADSGLPDCPQLKILRVNGSLFYGAVDHVQRQLERIDELNPRQKHLLIAATGINFVDMGGAEMLAREARRRRGVGGGLYFYRLKDVPRALLERGGYLDVIGRANLFPVKSRPVGAIYRRLDPEICRHCNLRIFRECHVSLPNGEPVPDTLRSKNP